MLQNLKMLREKNNVTQQKLAMAVGVSQQSINKYENHDVEPDIETLIRIADYFHTSVDYLIGHSGLCIEGQTACLLNEEERCLLESYRVLSTKEKDSVRLVIENYTT